MAQKKAKGKEKKGEGDYLSLIQEQISKKKRLFLFPFGILFLGFFVLFFGNNKTSSKDEEFFHGTKR